MRVASKLPENPADCKLKERSGVLLSDRLDVALVKTDQALTRANARVTRCDTWFTRLREARNGNAR